MKEKNIIDWHESTSLLACSNIPSWISTVYKQLDIWVYKENLGTELDDWGLAPQWPGGQGDTIYSKENA